jgi:Immunoglobulin-like domain of bacterial spore germination
VEGRVYLLRDGKVAPAGRVLSGTSQTDLLHALAAGPTSAERQAGLTIAGSGSRLRLAEVVYTLTQLNPTGHVTYDGKTYSRSDFEDVTPTILVESPLPFEAVRSPLRATGTANTFEATFQYELTEANGTVIAKHFVTATSGNGVRGTFEITIPFTVTSADRGTLTVYDNDAATGKRIHEVDIPLTLAP